MFLKNHRGAGMQHIAFHTPSILHTVQTMQKGGIDFRMPPPAYYHQAII